MTENESIDIIHDKIETCEFYFAENDRYPKWCEYEFLESLGAAISALKEVQQYRKIGTVEECKELAFMVSMEKKNALAKIIDEWKEYIEIGTVEECREAVEKQKPNKPHRNYKKFSGLWCKCGWYLGQKQCLDIKYCPNCGQAIDENLEGMEDE